MNWRRLYVTLEIVFTVSVFAAFISAFWAFLFSGLCRVVFHLSEDIAMRLVFAPAAILLFVACLILLPRALRRMGILSDSPSRFGPWFRH